MTTHRRSPLTTWIIVAVIGIVILLFAGLLPLPGQKDNVTPHTEPSAPGTSPQARAPTGPPPSPSSERGTGTQPPPGSATSAASSQPMTGAASARDAK